MSFEYKEQNHKFLTKHNDTKETDDATILYEMIKQSIEDKSQKENHNKDNISDQKKIDNIAEKSNIDFEELASSQADLSSILKKFLNKFKKNKKTKIKQNINDPQTSSNLNNDIAPSLGNEVNSSSSLSKSEQKKKTNFIKYISNLIFRNQITKQQVNTQLSDKKNQPYNKLSSKDKDKIIKDEHIKQLADAINNVGENSKKGRWVQSLSDTHIQNKDTHIQNKGRGV